MRVKRIKNIDYAVVNAIHECHQKGASYVDSMLEIAEKMHIDVDDISEMVDDELYNLIKEDFVRMKMVKDEKIEETVRRKDNISDIMKWLKQ